MDKKKGGNTSSNDDSEKKPSFWRRISIGRIFIIFLLIILILGMFSFFSLLAVVLIGPIPTGNIAVIPITGTIRSGDEGNFGNTASAQTIIAWIEDAEENEKIKAILLDINSGGGSAVASDEIAQAVKNAKKPTIAVIREVGASGAYWIASAADKVYANRMSITASIGVIGSYIEISELLGNYNMTYRRLVAGKHKDMGTPLKELTYEEEGLIQKALDEIHRFFIEAIVINRNMTYAQVEKIATGRFMIGVEAYELGLVDALGSKKDAVKFIEKELNITADLAEYQYSPSFYDAILSFSNKKISISFDSGAVMQT